ncbi:MAG: hypothetical protein H6Q94_160, partial [Nitrospirae bacterium]|nr:hypothetical protein [Nitrospirota bacterium]
WGFANIEQSMKQTVSAITGFRNLCLFFRLEDAGSAKSMMEVERKKSVSWGPTRGSLPSSIPRKTI